MSNSTNNIDFITDLFKTKFSDYYAHISDNRKESLFEHSQLVLEYFKVIIETHKLGIVIDKIIDTFVLENYTSQNKKNAGSFLLELFYAVPLFHDFGKINPGFQATKMNNNLFEITKNSLGSDHSKIGAFVFFQKFLNQANNNNFEGNERIINLFLVFAFSFSISKHHAPSIECYNEIDYSDEFINDVFKIVKDTRFFNYPEETILKIEKQINQHVLPKVKELISNNTFLLFALIKLNYSLLTASDYYATSHFMNEWKKMPGDFGVFNENLKKKIIHNIEISTAYNMKTYKELSNYQFEFPKEANGKNLNILRQNLAVEVINGIRANNDKNLFYIEAPTGAGKTNLSILALAELLREDLKIRQNNITKVFYVFPFTTLITQTYKSLKETLNLENDEIVQIHSKAGFSEKSSDDVYGKSKENIIDYQFVNYPVSLLSHIRFFDILKSNKKSTNYLMHRLANSVVIIDELQSYPPKEWDKVIYFINNYAKYFNIKFILMSATLPKIDKLLSPDVRSIQFKKHVFVSLIMQKNRYFTNPNFADRVEIDFGMLKNPDFDKKDREGFLQNLWDKLDKESLINQNRNSRVHTIIEFIFKKTASVFFELANVQNTLFDEIFILSGTILEPRRKEIIAKLKSDDYQSKNILLITTQVIEAGVDIDMDVGFKDSSLIDSDEQLAGRINRNINKTQCKLYLFDLDDAKIIYGNDDRFNKIQKEFKNDYANILKTKKFDKVYNSIMRDRNDFNHSVDYINLKDYLLAIKNLEFSTVHKDFKLIKDDVQNITFFIPEEVPIKVPYGNEANFTNTELDFLKEKNKHKKGDQTISGRDVWELFEKTIIHKNQDFVEQKKQIIILQGLMSNFTISVNMYSKTFKDIIISGYAEERYGYYYVHNSNDVYNYKTGFKPLEFEDKNYY